MVRWPTRPNFWLQHNAHSHFNFPTWTFFRAWNDEIGETSFFWSPRTRNCCMDIQFFSTVLLLHHESNARYDGGLLWYLGTTVRIAMDKIWKNKYTFDIRIFLGNCCAYKTPFHSLLRNLSLLLVDQQKKRIHPIRNKIFFRLGIYSLSNIVLRNHHFSLARKSIGNTRIDGFKFLHWNGIVAAFMGKLFFHLAGIAHQLCSHSIFHYRSNLSFAKKIL